MQASYEEREDAAEVCLYIWAGKLALALALAPRLALALALAPRLALALALAPRLALFNQIKRIKKNMHGMGKHIHFI